MSLDALREEILSYGTHDPDYMRRMMHPIPHASVADRVRFILDRCKGKSVLNIGSASGTLHADIGKVAKALYGIDKEASKGPTSFCVDLDHESVPFVSAIEIVVCGEVLEHLSNPGNFLQSLRQYQCPILVSVPNAFSSIAHAHIRGGVENVNADHVAWYSYRTLYTLVTRYGYEVKEFFWYHGKPFFAEGLIFILQ